MTTVDIQSLLDFVRFSHEIREVKRSMWVKDEEQFENDSEHGYQLALTALFIIDQDKLQLDGFKAMGLALVHDVPEIHAGDTPVYGPKQAINSQAGRERLAILQLQKQWPQFPLLHELIHEFETKVTPESKFIYALDKLLPMLNNYLNGGRNWKRMKVNIEDIIAIKAGKVDLDTTIKSYNDAALELIKQTSGLFYYRSQ